MPGDIISIKLGDIVPADARLLEGDPLKIDQASMLVVLAVHVFVELAKLKQFGLNFVIWALFSLL